MEFYAVAHHGTAGFDSYGYAELREGSAPRADQTTTVSGPFATREDAQAEVDQMNKELDAWRAQQS